MLGLSETAVLILVAVVLLGARKIPELARNAGRSARILKSEAKAMRAGSAPPAPTYVVTDVERDGR